MRATTMQTLLLAVMYASNKHKTRNDDENKNPNPTESAEYIFLLS